jgi:hypothetical protein
LSQAGDASGIGGLGAPAGIGPSSSSGLGHAPDAIGSSARQGISPGRTGGRDQVAGLGGLGSLARSSASARNPSTFDVTRQSLSEQANGCATTTANTNTITSVATGGADIVAPGRHPVGRRGGSLLRGCRLGVYYGYCGYSTEPVYYNYGSNVVYESTNVYVNGEAVATQQQYAQQARPSPNWQASSVTEDEEWLSLGVFAMVQGEQANGKDLFQLAVNKSGIIAATTTTR